MPLRVVHHGTDTPLVLAGQVRGPAAAREPAVPARS